MAENVSQDSVKHVSQDSVKHCSVSDNVQKPQKRPVPKGLTPFTPMTAKQAQEASARARSLRKQMRARLLDVAIAEGIDKYYAKALKNQDSDALEVVAKAAKLVGLDFASSEDAVQKVDVKSDNKVTTSGPLNITFSDAKPSNPEA